GADIAASPVDADHRGQSHVHDVEAAGLQLGRAAAAAAHVDDVDLEALRGVETGIAGHVPRQDGVDGIGDAGLDLDRLLRCRGLPADDNQSCSGADARTARTNLRWHRDSLCDFATLHRRRRTQNSRNSRPNPAIRSLTPQRRSASHTIAWCAAITLTPNSRSSASIAAAVGQCGDGNKIESASGCSRMSLRPMSSAAWRGMRPIWLKALPQPVAPSTSQPKWAP